ncbi:hypothetical protein QWY87_13280 [Lutimonas halocynthiae]|uniref:hypothetical protein n=1 Tax=Lutimonas halocynthiae TaxID=1446477 RepID=UPI0025B4D07F|nr:hypothetical protein [Lutimonas halocynthiae]MDN3643683.1 hypothetical protein [Lutimonas halocynthiae]
MQKIVLFCCLIFFSYQVSAQEIGIRFGDMTGNNIGIDATIPIKDKRIHATVSFGSNVGLDLIYDFAVASIFRSPDLRYYAGIGLTTLFASEFKLGVMGELGIEYSFPRTPISVGLDYRPAIIVIEKMDFIYGNFGLNVRYRFN